VAIQVSESNVKVKTKGERNMCLSRERVVSLLDAVYVLSTYVKDETKLTDLLIIRSVINTILNSVVTVEKARVRGSKCDINMNMSIKELKELLQGGE
jgi:hypothetical protein